MSSQGLLQNERLQQFLTGGSGTALFATALIALGAFVLSRILKRIIPRYIDDPDRRYRAAKLSGRLVGVAAVVAIVFVWSAGDGPGLATILTLIGAGLAIALREVVLSFVAWINIVIRTPFELGDRIEVNGIQGDVIDIRLLHSTLMETGGWVDADQSTGRIVHFPNGWMYQYGIYNYTHGFKFLWNEIPFTVTSRSDWNAAREIMLDLASETAEIVEQQVKREIRQMSREFLVHYSILTPFVYVRVASNGVQLTLRYLTEVRKRRGTEHALTVSILSAFNDHDRIELAYGMVGGAQMNASHFGSEPGDRTRGGIDRQKSGS